MTIEGTDTVIFTDDSGTRRRRLAWTMRLTSVALVVGIGLVAVSVVGHVTLPGLDSPLQLPGTGPSPRAESAVRSPSSTPAPVPSSTSAPVRTGDRTSTDSAADDAPAAKAPDESAPASAAPTPLVAPTPAPDPPQETTKPHGKPTAKPTTAANPERGGRPSEPPGKAKKTTDAS